MVGVARHHIALPCPINPFKFINPGRSVGRVFAVILYSLSQNFHPFIPSLLAVQKRDVCVLSELTWRHTIFFAQSKLAQESVSAAQVNSRLCRIHQRIRGGIYISTSSLSLV